MTKLEAQVVKAALIWHAVNAITGRPLHHKHDQALRQAAINLLKKQKDKELVQHLESALKRKRTA